MGGTVMAMAVVVAVAGCGSIDDLFRGGPREQSRVRSDVTEYTCADGKTLSIKMDPGAKAAWVVLPDREYRLDAVAGASDRYSNGRTTLITTNGETSLEEAGATPGAVNVSGCKRR
jgi:hypothetical protein